ncbi:response regulator transcription factor [Cohnella cholangitidis]|uniref:Response regulator transcription factor n=1 Tax=Cohnella cholangitidis TaxID=2598458 RepID=A0A7G5C119_9BACL|nr:response regulator transcription factor [Cohnella cholangitidis]QMV42903.1 response regulator transcription factor [Cohnella cholangitidis]
MKKILIIEDEPSIAQLQRDYLEISGFAADIVAEGDAGIRQSLTGQYDLILLDVMLPKADGFEVCRTIRSKIDIPIIFISAKKEELDKIRALGLGADDYMIKPFSPGEMVARVKAHLSRYDRLRGDPVAQLNEINIRGLKIDRAAHRVFVNDKEITVTAKEFDLLTFLADHPNRVFSKEHLFEQLWGFDAAGDLSTVTVHIRKLREKIEADPSDPQYIETVWGAGYRFTV